MSFFSPMQQEFWQEAVQGGHRWNVKTGATRSGKTYQDYFLIPRRLLAVAGKEGLNVILGNTRETIRRNIILPMQNLYGIGCVSNMHADNSVTMFGEQVFCLGCENINRVDRLRGASVKYCYGDEVTTWHPDVFEMLKSRLDKPYSAFDGTCNPEGPGHWFHRFLLSDADIFQQAYTIDDNPFLAPSFVENLKREYAGTVYYNRFILGQWVAAEGAIYRAFADRPEDFILDGLPERNGRTVPVRHVVIGVDFGGGTSAHAFCCLGFLEDGSLMVLDEYREQAALDPIRLEEDFVQFVSRCRQRWIISDVWCDSAEKTLINGLRTAAARCRLPVNIGEARKRIINDRIRAMCILMGSGRFHILRKCRATIDALQNAVWDGKYTTEDVRLDDGTTNIDSLDAMEYAYERDIENLIETWGR